MTDPIEAVPIEAISPAFSFLSTPQLSLMTGVSRRWRNVLQSDSLLNRIVDLTNLKTPLQEMEMIQVVQRLPRLTSHPQNELRLDLSSFYDSFCQQDRDFGSIDIRPTTYLSLLSAIAVGSKGKLDKIFLQIPHTRLDLKSLRPEDVTSFGPYIIQAWDELAMMVEVRELHFEVPFHISVDSKAANGELKRFTVTNDIRDDNIWIGWKVENLSEFLNKVVDFTGAGIRQLGIRTTRLQYGIPVGEQNAMALFGIIERFKESIEVLDLAIGTCWAPEMSFEAIVNCPNLQRLQLIFFTEEDELLERLAPVHMPFPLETPKSHLKSLELESDKARMDFFSPSFVNWVGEELVTLKLKLFSKRSIFTKVSMESLGLILISNPDLEHIELSRLSVFKASPSFPIQLNLPKLKFLKLDSVYLSGHEMFTNAFLPALHTLKLRFFYKSSRYGDPRVEMKSGAAFSNVLPIIQNCKSSLRVLELADDEPLTYEEEQEVQKAGDPQGNTENFLSLGLVEEFSLSTGSAKMAKLVRKFQLSSLKILKLSLPFAYLLAISEGFLNSSAVSLQSVSLSSEWDQPSSAEYRSQEQGNASFPNLLHLELQNKATLLTASFALSSFGKLEKLQVSDSESNLNLSQSSKEGCLRSAFSIIQSEAASLRSIVLCGFGDVGKMKFEEKPVALPKLQVLNISVSSSSLSQCFFHCQFSNLLELSLDGVPTNSSIDDLLHFINPHSASLQKLNLARLVYDKEQIRAKTRKLSHFPNLLSIRFNHCSFYVLKMFSKSRYPNLHHLSAGNPSAYSDENPDRIYRLWRRNAPNLSLYHLQLNFSSYRLSMDMLKRQLDFLAKQNSS